MVQEEERRMRILLSNYALKDVGGSEKWTYDMYNTLVDMNHDVDVYTAVRGKVSDQIGMGMVLEPRNSYDLIIANQTKYHPIPEWVDGFRVYVSHGPQHPLEEPAEGADVYVGVSQEVVDARSQAVPGDWRVICNGFDLEEFYPAMKAPEKALIACKSADACNMAAVACHDAGVEYKIVHYIRRPVWDMAEEMRQFDFVIGIGRTAAEGIATGLDVLLFNEPHPRIGPRTDGWITEENVADLHGVNFSARYRAERVNLEQLTDLIKSRPERQGWQRDWAMKHLDVKSKASEYITLVPKGTFNE